MFNAGENKLLEARCKSKDWRFGIEFEYTARATHQHNHMAELGFATLGNKGRAMMVISNIPEKYRNHLFRESFCTSTDLDGLVVMEIKGKKAARFFHMYGKNPEWVDHIRTFGEAGTVKIKTDTTPKLHDRGVQCMFAG
jgi:hypothetical protein